MSALGTSRESSLVALSMLMMVLLIVEPRQEISSKSTLREHSSKDSDQSKSFLAWASNVSDFFQTETSSLVPETVLLLKFLFKICKSNCIFFFSTHFSYLMFYIL